MQRKIVVIKTDVIVHAVSNCGSMFKMEMFCWSAGKSRLDRCLCACAGCGRRAPNALERNGRALLAARLCAEPCRDGDGITVRTALRASKVEGAF